MKSHVYVQLLIQEALNAIEEALSSKSVSRAGPMSRSQLQRFQKTLLSMLRNLAENENMIHLKYEGGMGRTIVDSWPMDSPLGEVILKAEQEYLSFIVNKKSSD